MARKAGDINAKIAYLTNPKTGPILKVKRPMLLQKVPQVSGNQKANVNSCKEEVTKFFQCMRENDYYEKHCTQQLKALVACHDNALASKMAKLKAKKEKTKPQQEADSSSSRLSRIYQRFPNPVHPKSTVIQRNIYKTSYPQLVKIAPYVDRGQFQNRQAGGTDSKSEK